MSPQPLVAALRTELQLAANPERAAQEKRYLKSDLQFWGCGLTAVRTTARSLRKLPRAALLTLCSDLWATDVHELHALAVVLLEQGAGQLEPEDLEWLCGLLRTSHTWAYVDSLAAHTAGNIVKRHPQTRAVLRQWATDEDVWIRRSALLGELVELRSGRGDFSHFEALAVPMLADKSFWIRKAIGWVLREVGRKRPELVRAFVAAHGPRMAPLTLREATRRLPPI